MGIVYLNGQFIPQENATVSIMDRGFLFGDGVYEAIPVYQGQMLALQQHLTRLKLSLAAIKIAPPLSDTQWENVLRELLAHNNKQNDDQSIYIQVTRGAEDVRSHAIPDEITPTLLALCYPPKKMALARLNEGLSAITLEDRRRHDCYIKAINLLPNILAYHQAQTAHSAEAILIRDGEALEGTSSNLFIVKDNTIQTPPISPKILAGVTRELILQLARENNIAHKEAAITEKMLWDADEIWLTGSLKEIYPIVTLNDKPIGNGKVGPLWHTVKALYEKFKTCVKTPPSEQPEQLQ